MANERDELSEFDSAADSFDGKAPEPVQRPETPAAPAPAAPEADTKAPMFNIPEGILPELHGSDAPVADTPKPAEKPKPETPVAPTGVGVELADLRADLRRERERSDEFMRAALRGEFPAQRPTTPKVEPIEIEPETRAAVQAVVDETLAPLKPAMEEAAINAHVEACESKMKGFRELWPEVQKAFKELPIEEQLQYDNRSGALLLAKELVEKRQATESLSRRAHSETVPNPTAGSGRARPMLTPQMIYDMSEEDFAKLVEANSGRGEVAGYVDPLLQ